MFKRLSMAAAAAFLFTASAQTSAEAALYEWFFSGNLLDGDLAGGSVTGSFSAELDGPWGSHNGEYEFISTLTPPTGSQPFRHMEISFASQDGAERYDYVWDPLDTGNQLVDIAATMDMPSGEPSDIGGIGFFLSEDGLDLSVFSLTPVFLPGLNARGELDYLNVTFEISRALGDSLQTSGIIDSGYLATPVPAAALLFAPALLAGAFVARRRGGAK